MAFTSEEIDKIKKVMDKYIEDKRPPIEIRDKVDLAYKFENQSIEIFEIRPEYKGIGIINIPIAKTTFNRTTNSWKIYWQRADLKWHLYEPKKEVKKLSDFVKIVDEDKHCCFFG